MAVALLVVPVPLQEKVLRQLEHEREQHQQLVDDVVVDVPREGLDLGAVAVDDVGVWLIKGGDELRDVVDLGVVVYAWPNFLDEGVSS